jgi:hypothetical protein
MNPGHSGQPDPVVTRASRAFGLGEPVIEVLHSGLIHDTYKISEGNRSLVLQHINEAVFPEPDKIIRNYLKIVAHLEGKNGLKIPAPVQTIDGNFSWSDGQNQYWRATEFIPDSYIESASISVSQTFKVATCFGQFAQDVSDLDPNSIEIVIPGFHDLGGRFAQFEQAFPGADVRRLQKVKRVIEGIRHRKGLVDFYQGLSRDADFRIRTMHHDCKISNILFHTKTKNPICPIDLDTVMPGYYFSDIGDLIRSLAGSVSEGSTDLHSLVIRKPYYEAILRGYQEGIGNAFTKTETRYIHHAGLLMIYVQCIRFLTDYLSGDRYYKVTYPEQNADRAENQFRLLEKLEEFLWESYQYDS